MNDPLTIAMFNVRVGQAFAAAGEGHPAVELTLIEVKALPNHAKLAREPFSLLFTSQGEFVAPQGLYEIRRDDFGPRAIFIVPIAAAGGVATYQAIFN